MVEISRRRLTELFASVTVGLKASTISASAENSPHGINWKKQPDVAGRAAPVHHSGALFLPGKNLSVLDASDGREIWSASGQYPTQGTVGITRNTVAVPFGPDKNPRPESRLNQDKVLPSETFNVAAHGQDEIIGMDRETGQFKWRFNPREFGFLNILGTRNGVIYVGESDDNPEDIYHRVFAVDEETGEAKWSVTVGDVLEGQAVISDNSLIAASDTKIWSISEGKINWTYDAGTNVWSPKILGQYVVIQGTTGVTLIEADSGDLVRSYKANTLLMGDTVSVDSNNLYVGETSGEISAMGTNQEVQWTNNVENKIIAPPQVGADNLYVMAKNSLNCLEKKSGSLNWSRSFSKRLIGRPLVLGDTLYIQRDLGKTGSQVLIIDSANGHTLQTFAPSTELSFIEKGSESIYTFGNDGRVFSLG